MPAKRVAIVHGVQTGTDADAVRGPKILHERIKTMVGKRFAVSADFPAYESINDESIGRFKEASKAIVNGLSGGTLGAGAATLLDLIGDVFIYNFTKKSLVIRKHVREVIEQGDCHVLVGHSLGSVVCFDILTDMIADGLFDGPKSTWPVKYFVSFGSPLTLRLFAANRALSELGEGKRLFWYNYFDRSDPVPAGTLFGTPRSEFENLRKLFRDEDVDTWHIYDNVIDTGFNLLSHINYWGNNDIGARVSALLGKA